MPKKAFAASSSGSSALRGNQPSVIRIKPFHYIHVLDNNSGVTKLLTGPQTFTRQEHERVLSPGGASIEMIMIPPRHYCYIKNPVEKKGAEAMVDDNGNYKVRHGDAEIRFEQQPFPLYPGEVAGAVEELRTVKRDTALKLRASRDFYDEANEVSHVAGDEWYFVGPGTYIPRVEVEDVGLVTSVVIKKNEALRVRAERATKDCYGFDRKDGEEWLVRETGPYLLGVDESKQAVVPAEILTDRRALHLVAKHTFTDVFDVTRKAGVEWLVTHDMTESYIPDVQEEIKKSVDVISLNALQYVVVLDPIGPDGKPQLGKREVRRGERAFFLHPGERLQSTIRPVHILSEEEALLLRAKEAFHDGKVQRNPGDRWMVYGPRDYVPPVEVEEVELREATPLDENEGIYVRDIKTGRVGSVIGESYMLKPNEELWEKDLPSTVEQLLKETGGGGGHMWRADGSRDKTRVVTLRAPHNSAVQIYDYKERQSRVLFGPDLVMLGADEDFTVLSLSGGKPKKPHAIKSLALNLGPEFMTDIVTVETSDHARLRLRLSYNWFFDVDRNDPTSASRLFNVPDFVGDGCKAIGARIRGAVASSPFDLFHKQCARIIRKAVFGLDEDGHVNNRFVFHSNGLVITNIDIQAVEPVDHRTRESLMESVQLAIEITTKSQEARARHEAERKEQDAKGELQKQQIRDQAVAEQARQGFVQLQAACSAIKAAGVATAEAEARSKAAEIEGQANVAQAKMRAEAQRIRTQAELDDTRLRQEAEVEHKRALTNLEIARSQELAKIDSNKFKSIVQAIGPKTIASIAQAGPSMQAQLLEGLGLQSLLLTDGKSPVNLFSAAEGLIQDPEN